MATHSKVFDEMRTKVATHEDVLRRWGKQPVPVQRVMSILFDNMQEIGTWTDDEDERINQAQKIIKRMECLPDNVRQEIWEDSENYIFFNLDEMLVFVFLSAIYDAMFIHFMQSRDKEKQQGRPSRMQEVNVYLAQKAAQQKAKSGDSWPTVADDLIDDLKRKNDRNEVEEAVLKKLLSNKSKMPRGRTGDFLQMYVFRYMKSLTKNS